MISFKMLTTVDFPFDPVTAIIFPFVYHEANSISLTIGILFSEINFIELFFLQSIPGLITAKLKFSSLKLVFIYLYFIQFYLIHINY